MSGVLQALLGLSSGGIPTVRAVGTSVGGANPAVPYPTLAANDILVLVGVGDTTQYTLPAGWSTSASQSSAPRLAVFYKTATGSESGTLAVTGGGNNAQMVMFSIKNTSGLDVNGTLATASSTTIATNSLTTTQNNSIVVSAFAENANGTVPGSITGTTIIYADNTTGRSLVVATEKQVAAGATAARTCVFGSSGSCGSMAISFKP